MKLGAYISMKDQLGGEYLKTFEFVEHYGEIHMVSAEVMAEKMMDLMDLMLEAQENAAPVERVVGSHTEDFCKNYFSDVTRLDFLKSAARQLRFMAWFLLVLEVVFFLSEPGNEPFFSYRTDISGYLMGILIAWLGVILADIVGSILARFGNYSKKIWSAVAIAGTAAAVILAVLFAEKVGSVSVPGFPLVLCSGGYLLVYYAVVFTSRFRATGSLKKPSNAYETTFTGLVKTELKNTDYSREMSVVKTFSKRYKRVNARREKRGRAPLTTEEFFEKLDRESRWSTLAGVSCGILVILLISLLTGEALFESWSDVPIFLLIFGGILAGYVWFMRKIDKVRSLEQNGLLKACREKGLELDRYYEALLEENSEDTEE